MTLSPELALLAGAGIAVLVVLAGGMHDLSAQAAPWRVIVLYWIAWPLSWTGHVPARSPGARWRRQAVGWASGAEGEEQSSVACPGVGRQGADGAGSGDAAQGGENGTV